MGWLDAHHVYRLAPLYYYDDVLFGWYARRKQACLLPRGIRGPKPRRRTSIDIATPCNPPAAVCSGSTLSSRVVRGTQASLRRASSRTFKNDQASTVQQRVATCICAYQQDADDQVCSRG